MGRNHKTFPKDDVQKLKEANRRLKSDNLKLLSQIATLEEALKKTFSYLEGETKNISLEELLNGNKENKKLKDIKPICEKCQSKSFTTVKSIDRIIRICNNCNARSIAKKNNE